MTNPFGALTFDERAIIINKGPYDDRDVELNGSVKRLYMGGILGGGRALSAGP